MHVPGTFFTVIAALVSLLAAVPARADVQLKLQDGRVWLDATNATASQILAVWAKVGQTRIVNGERLSAPAITLQLNGVPESEALDLVLRSASGFVAAPRPVRLTDASLFDRILILPTSTGTAQPPPSRTPTPPVYTPLPSPAGVTRIIGADGLPVPDDQDDAPPPGVTPASAPGTPTPASGGSTGTTPPRGNPPPGVSVPGMIVPAPAVAPPEAATEPPRN
jgi:hypothetical protein